MFSSNGPRSCQNTKECWATTMPVDTPYNPVCECLIGYARLPNGACVHAEDPECYEFYKPTPGIYNRKNNPYMMFQGYFLNRQKIVRKLANCKVHFVQHANGHARITTI